MKCFNNSATSSLMSQFLMNLSQSVKLFIVLNNQLTSNLAVQSRKGIKVFVWKKKAKH